MKGSVAHLVLQARTQDQVIVGHSPASRHTHAFGLPVDAHHLPGHHGDTGVQRQLGQVSTAVCMAAESRTFLSLSALVSGKGCQMLMFRLTWLTGIQRARVRGLGRVRALRRESGC